MGARQSVQTATTTAQQQRQHTRAPSTTVVPATSSNGHAASTSRRSHRTFSLPNANGDSAGPSSNAAVGTDSDSSEELDLQRVLQLPALRFNIPRLRQGGTAGGAGSSQRRALSVFPLFDIKCPVCNKIVPSDEAEVHLVMCLTRPRITYNDDILTENKDECVICFEEMVAGDAIARLPCLCIYHKICIDRWFTKKNCCPEHPGED
uniref:E3 ubiquitin-protein ligase ZNRF1 n=1 Tax=Plectus sambesii TaxID=2011161 RepID=A0A914VY73_9BILA